MTQTRAHRGPLLSSVLMVMLATAATGLLAFIGFQALPESVVPSTFDGDGHETRNVDVTETPSATASTGATGSPGATPTATPTATRGGTVQTPVPTAPGTVTTTPPRSTTSPPRTTSPTPTAPPTTASTKPSPTPTCGKGRAPKCPKTPRAYDDSEPDRTFAGTGDAPTFSASEGKKTPKPAKRARRAR